MGWDFSKNPLYAENAQPGQVFSSVPGVSAPDGNNYYTGDFRYEPLSDWSRLTLPQTLWEQGDSRGAFGDAYTKWKAEQDAAKQSFMDMGYGSIPGWEFTPAAGSFTGYTREQLDEYLRPNESVLQDKNRPYIQQIVRSSDGNDYVSNAGYKDEKTFGSMMGDLVGPALMAGVRALSGGFGLADILKGVGADASWGVNPQGANMDFSDFITNTYNPGEFTGSMLPGGSNSLFGELGGGMVDLGGGAASVAGAGWSPNFLDTITSGIQQLGSSAAQTAAKSALGKVLSGQGTQQDLMSLLGALGATGLGVYGSNQQSNALEKIANQSRADRQPFLNASLGWLNDPSSYYAGAPAQAAMKGVLQGLSVNGNPANNPTAMSMASEAGLRNWQNAVTGFGNIGLSGQDSRNNLLAGAAQADSGVYDALGYGLNQLTQPKQSLSDLARAFGITGLA